MPKIVTPRLRIPISVKSYRKRKKKEGIYKSALKLELTKHAECRLEERFDKHVQNIRVNILNSIICGRVKYFPKAKCYKVYGDFGIYILGENYKVITLMNENRGSKIDKFYRGLTKEEFKKIKSDLKII